MAADDNATDLDRQPRREKSLLARALGHLARREHSRVELGRKLAPYAGSKEELDALLADLEAKKLLSDQRFSEVLARSRGERFGAARVKQELRARGVADETVRNTVAELGRTELQRARAVWQRKFDALPASAAERARQMRFLAQRGFSGDVIRRIVGGRDDDD
jgi:regulatory protein